MFKTAKNIFIGDYGRNKWKNKCFKKKYQMNNNNKYIKEPFRHLVKGGWNY